MEYTEFWTLCTSNSIMLTKKQLDDLDRYHKELVYWNKSVNLISRKDEENVMEKHILHSLSILRYANIAPKSYCLDVGTGGGLPGIPIKIAVPECRMTLIDSIAKKTKLTAMFASHTGLKQIDVICDRAENLAINKSHLGKYDFIISRAVAPIEELIDWTLELLKPVTGKFVFLKGGDLTEEVNEAKDRFKKLKIQVKPLQLFGYDKFEKEDKKIVICEF